MGRSGMALPVASAMGQFLLRCGQFPYCNLILKNPLPAAIGAAYVFMGGDARILLAIHVKLVEREFAVYT